MSEQCPPAINEEEPDEKTEIETTKPDEKAVEKKQQDGEDSDSDYDENAPKPWYVWFCRGLTAFIVIGGIIFIIVRRDITRAVLEWFVNWLSNHRWWGPIALFVIYLVAQTVMIPCIALVLGAGYGLMKAYGSFWQAQIIATFACWMGMWAGSITGMLFARYLFRKKAKAMSKKYQWMSAFDMAIDTDGVMFLIIMRACPLVPFAMQNYVIGATAMKMRNFAPTGIFMVPWTGMMVFYGTTLSNIHDAVTGNYKMGPFGLTAMIAGSIIAILASIFLSCAVKKHLDKMVKEAEEKKQAVLKARADAEKGNPQGGSNVDLVPDEVNADMQTDKAGEQDQKHQAESFIDIPNERPS